jgi:hypothetical protein
MFDCGAEVQIEYCGRGSCTEGDPGLWRSSAMNTDALWNRILAAIATKIPVGCFDTWFRPLEPSRLDRSVLHVTLPSESFRAAFTANYWDLLHQTVIEAAGFNIELQLSIAESKPLQAEEGCVVRAQPLPVVRASEIEAPVHRQSWLIDRLWTHQAVGVIGGSPKSGKTWLALEMAVSIASGRPCFDTFAVASPGPVLLYAAEDSALTLRSRLETLARLHKIDFERLNVHVITIDSLRLDHPEHQDRLESTLHAYKPTLLVLDPLVRVHSIDENVAGQVAALLGYLRSLQRKAGTAIALVHHVRKNASPTGNAGYSLRGSGDLYAWLDSFLYLRMHQGQRMLSAEHRSAPAFGPIALELVQADPMGPHLRMTSVNEAQFDSPQSDLSGRILELLSSSHDPQTVDAIRSHLQVRNQRVVEAIRNLASQGKIQRHPKGFSIPILPPQLQL